MALPHGIHRPWVQEQYRSTIDTVVQADVLADMDEQMAVVWHNSRWLVRLGLRKRRPMPDPLWPRALGQDH
jgi:hypothetical protein